MMIAALAVTSALATATPATAGDPSASDANPLIVGGQDATEPYAGPVSLHMDGRGIFCGGTLIHPRWVLTAAHCGFFGNRPQHPPKPADKMFVRYGTQRIDAGPTVRVDRVVTHPDWRWGQGRGNVGDLALIKLDRPVEASTATLASTSPDRNDPVRLVGFGVTGPKGTGPNPDTLQQVDTTVAPDERCASGGISGPTELCVADELPHVENTDRPGACYGDSGSPALQPVGHRWVQVGVTSRSGGEQTATPCGGHPDIYTDITAPVYQRWIATTIATQ